MEKCNTVEQYAKNHKVTGIVTETDALWDIEDGDMSEFKVRTIKAVKGTMLTVY